MKVTVLIDDNEKEGYISEHGLSLWIEYEGEHILLDTGSTGAFSENAKRLGINLADADIGVLSHAHWDHTDGMERFFSENDKAPFYFRRECGENTYSLKENEFKYIGIHKGWLQKFSGRIRYVDGKTEILPGVWLIPHSESGIAEISEKVDLYMYKDGNYYPDPMEHEQSLVFDTDKGLVIFNSCSHGGADRILREASSAFPGRPLKAILGGFHLKRWEDGEIRCFAERMRRTGIRHVATGHCTGDRAFEILREELGNGVIKMCSGLTLEL